MRRAAAAALLLTIVACRAEPVSRDWAGTIETRPDDVVVVNNPEAGIWTAATRWTLDEDLRIGGDDEDTDGFDAIFQVTADSSGRIYVSLGRRSQVRVFDRNGRFLRTIGRHGKGPGEFGFPSEVAFDSSGNAWISDSPNQRYSVFDTAGHLVATRPRNLFLDRDCLRFLADGRLLDCGVSHLGPSVSQIRIGAMDSAGNQSSFVGIVPGDSVATTEMKPVPPFHRLKLFTVNGRGMVYTGNNNE